MTVLEQSSIEQTIGFGDNREIKIERSMEREIQSASALHVEKTCTRFCRISEILK